MNIKPIEMQIAIPRTQDASQSQQQNQQKPVSDQQLLSDKAVKQAEEQLKKPNQVENAAHKRIQREFKDAEHGRKDQQRKSATDDRNGQEQAQERKANPANHPFKGKHIDFSL